MDIEHVAYLYVTYFEPLLKVLLFAAIVIIVLHTFNALRDGKKHSDIISFAFNSMIKGLVAGLVFLGKGFRAVGEMLLKVIKIIFASIRDFFTSNI